MDVEYHALVVRTAGRTGAEVIGRPGVEHAARRRGLEEAPRNRDSDPLRQRPQ